MEDRPAPGRSRAPLVPVPNEQAILENINGRVHGPIRGFIIKHFGVFQYARKDAVLEIQAPGRATSRCAVPPAAPSPDDFLQWFPDFTSREADGARGSWHFFDEHTTPGPEGGGGGACILLSIPNPSAPEPGWGNVQVICQFYRRDTVRYEDGLVRLCKSAHQVFTSQPTRLFVHGLYIRGSLVELWMFDRSGLYCSELFDIQRDFFQFYTLVLSYQRMTDAELGISNFVDADEGGSFVTLRGPPVVALGKLYLESQPIALRDDLVGTGTTCYRARLPGSDRWTYVLKLKWRRATGRPENELLRLAKSKSTWGAPSLHHFGEIESTANIRRGIRWGKHRKFASLYSPWASSSFEAQQQNVPSGAGGLAEYTEETQDRFQSRILDCIVTSPVGRPIHTFRSLLELLRAFRDTIKYHQSLYYDASILHRDVCPGNMIILDGQDERKPEAILIDLDSATSLTGRPDPDQDIAGTLPFMAVGVLKSEPHTYRHDLESFLYAFLWTVIANHTERPPETSKLRQWSSGDRHELARRKYFDMTEDRFETILWEFGPEFHSVKPLARNLRQVLFPLWDGVIWTETDDSPEAIEYLYNGMIRAFEAAIAFETQQSYY